MDSLAQRLREERERQQRSLRDLASETKILEPFLQALENADYAVLPTVYIKSFIRTYATALGLSSIELASLLESIVETDDDGNEFFPRKPKTSTNLPPTALVPSTQSNRAPSTPSLSHVTTVEAAQKVDRTSVRLGDRSGRFLRAVPLPLLAAIALIVLTALIWLVVKVVSDAQHDTEATDPTTTVNADNTIIVSDGGELDSIILTAVASDSVWLTITTDGKGSQTLVMVPGSEGRWSAMTRFDVSIGNAGGIDLYRNGIQLPPLGRKGDLVRSAVITRTDVTSSSQAFMPPKPQQPSASGGRPTTQPASASRPSPARSVAPSTRSRASTSQSNNRRNQRQIPDITPPPRPSPR
jgi:Helix-turn-helix domain/Domain of unknown function (DUF4115)